MLNNELRLLFWETTAGCNLACIHCRRLDIAKEMMKNDLSTKEAFKFVDDIAEFAKPILVLSGGEPLIRSDIFDISRYAGWKGLTVSLATNGTLIDSTIAKEISDSGIRRVAISIDGADEKTHDSFRKQPGSLAKALEGFKLCKSLGLSMQINCTITRHNKHQADQLYKMALELGADALHLFMLVPVGCGVQIAESNMLPDSEYEEVLNWIYDRTLEGKIHLKATCAPHYMRVMRQRAKTEGRTLTMHKEGYKAMTIGCLAGNGICFVSHKGEVFPCGYLPINCGNVRNQRLAGIWSGSNVFSELRNPNLLGGKCGICEFRNVCLGCRARAYYATGSYMEEEPYCVYKPVRMSKAKMRCEDPW